MKHSMQKLGQGAFVLAFGAIAVFGATVLSSNRAEAAPGLLCGPTILWICTLPNGSQVPFGGTVCQKTAYEKRTGAHCTAGG